LGLLFVGAVVALLADIVFTAPDFKGLKTSVKVPILLASGEKSFKWMGPDSPQWVSFSHISPYLPKAVIASEDASFYSHDGIDVHEIKEALKKDIKEGRFARGASTLTQQVLKNVYLGSDIKLLRKIKEIFWARQLEKALTKNEILAFYLNMAEWAPGIYGIREAALHYFGSTPASLTPKQCAFLTMLLPSPRRYHTYFKNRVLTEWAARRVNRILQIMNKMGTIEDPIYQTAMAEQLWGHAPIPDNTPGVPSDPGIVTDDEFRDFEKAAEISSNAKVPSEKKEDTPPLFDEENEEQFIPPELNE
jgi:monofunctional biosynthetic peptidoglycan transglycosylase